MTGPALARRPSNRCSVAASTRHPRPGATGAVGSAGGLVKWWHLVALPRRAGISGRAGARTLCMGPWMHSVHTTDALSGPPILGSNKLGRQEGWHKESTWMFCVQGCALYRAQLVQHQSDLRQGCALYRARLCCALYRAQLVQGPTWMHSVHPSLGSATTSDLLNRQGLTWQPNCTLCSGPRPGPPFGEYGLQ